MVQEISTEYILPNRRSTYDGGKMSPSLFRNPELIERFPVRCSLGSGFGGEMGSVPPSGRVVEEKSFRTGL